METALQLDGVHLIEAEFAASLPGDRQAITEVENATVFNLAYCVESEREVITDILEASARALWMR
jgi:hypothetical protein